MCGFKIDFKLQVNNLLFVIIFKILTISKEINEQNWL